MTVETKKEKKITFDPSTTPGLPRDVGDAGDEVGGAWNDVGEKARADLNRIESIVKGEGSFDPAEGPIHLANLAKTMSRSEREIMELE